jgi:taurine dioxygenase
MLTIEPTGVVLGATVRGIDLARPLREPDLGRILLALGKHGVLRFPDQHLDLGALKGRVPVSCGSFGTVESVLCTVMLMMLHWP